MKYLELLFAFVFMRLNHNYYEQFQLQHVNNQQNQSKALDQSADMSQYTTHNMSSMHQSKNVSIFAKLQTQDFFLQQALKHFKEFKVEHLDDFESQLGRLFLMMFLHVQDELVFYRILKQDGETKMYKVVHDEKLKLI